MTSNRAAALSLILASVSACATTPGSETLPPFSVQGAGAGASAGGRGGTVAPPLGTAASGGSPGVAGSVASAGIGAGGTSAGGTTGGPTMGIAGTYADDYPPCDEALAAVGTTGGSAGSASGGSGAATGAGGATGSGSAGKSGGAGASAGGSGAAATSGTPATFSEVYNLITCKTCGLCHGTGGGLAFTGGKSATYEALLGSDLLGKPTGTAAETGMCTGQKRVVPGMPDQSLFYLKVSGTQKCGTIMPPPPAPALNAAQAERVRSWIMAGAKKN